VTGLPVWVDVTAMAANGFFAAAVARNRGFPVFGTLMAGILVGLGGGMVRDVLLDLEPAAIAGWYYIPAVITASIVGALVFSRVVRMPTPALFASGVVWGLLVAIGVQKAVDYDAPAASAIFLGVVTTTVGGVLVDAMSQKRATIAKQAHWTLTALVVGSAVFWVATVTLGFWVALAAGVATTTILRVLSVRRDWPSPTWPGEPVTDHPTDAIPEVRDAKAD
jgi:uncharacterized membrane protein YeiH